MNAANTMAAKLKGEGNDLYIKGEYEAAAAMYTLAVEVDDADPVLFANRADCFNNMCKFEEGLNSALKATQLNPSYVDGWCRLAQANDALKNPFVAAGCWARAIHAVPFENRTFAHGSEFSYFITAMAKSKEAAKAKFVLRGLSEIDPDEVINIPVGHKPWECAVRLLPQLNANEMSCVWVLVHAHADFDRGLQALKGQAFRERGVVEYARTNKHGFTVPESALRDLSGAFTGDERVMHIDDSQSYADMVNKMRAYFDIEVKQSKAPDPAQKLKHICSEFIHIQKADGWHRVRPIVTTTVRSLLLRGHVSTTLRRDYETGYRSFKKAAQILAWGPKEWIKVHTDDRGAVFTDSFFGSVARCSLVAYQQAYIASRGRNSQFTLDELMKGADEMIAHAELTMRREIPAISPDQKRTGFVTSYVIYPKAQAYATKGFCYAEKIQAGLCKRAADEKAHRQQAINAYMTAVDLYPEDEELHILHLTNALDLYFRGCTTLRVILPVMERIRRVTPSIMTIWWYSDLMQSRLDGVLRDLAVFKAEVREKMSAGEPGYGLDDAVVPPWLKLVKSA